MKKFKFDKKTKRYKQERPFIYYARWSSHGICDEEWGIVWAYTKPGALKKLDKDPLLKFSVNRIERESDFQISKVIE